MKKRIIQICFTVLTIVGMNSCDNEYEPILADSPDDRVRKQIEWYEMTLTSAPFGWKTSLYTGTSAGYFYHFEFMNEGKVTMISDFNISTAGSPMESTWTVKGLQRPTLSFDTYSYVHLPADPDGDVNNGIPGNGLISDFEFAFSRVTTDTIYLEGIQHGTKAVMTRATELERQAYGAGELENLVGNTIEYLAAGISYRLTLPNSDVVPLAISLQRKRISIQYMDSNGETIRATSTSFFFTPGGIQLRENLDVHGFKLKELRWIAEVNGYAAVFEENVLLDRSVDPFIFSPTTPLHTRLGQQLIVTTIPQVAVETPLVGHSESFTEALQYAASEMKSGPYLATLNEVKFTFIPNTDRMIITLTLSQPNGAAPLAKYTYSYSVRENGTVKFKLETFDDNAGALFEYMVGILNHFDNDTFRMEYLGGDFTLLGGFFSQEDPSYHFSGYLEAQNYP